MSWTVPVPAYQYMDYQNRTIGLNKQNRYTIERTNSIMLERRPDTFEQRVQDRLDYQASMQASERKQEKTKQTPLDKQTYSLLTGKGRHIDTVC
ncbi:hypothetical protein SFC66_13345 [Terribacillus saccharophilus]|uniref:hypothetical protein n=1 Tax=Terribacillus saccharophilus TaxID=361277 RepID=UPI0039820CA8